LIFDIILFIGLLSKVLFGSFIALLTDNMVADTLTKAHPPMKVTVFPENDGSSIVFRFVEK
jgi:hypothetical protein